ncbi:MAG: DUF4358 domain-containing protein [Ruminococcus sp.]|nr:DUF4358 domain-containing protein [Ruminococcus sp.]
MAKKKYLIAEILCVLALAAFITGLWISRSGGTDKDIQTISAPVIQSLEKSGMTQKSNSDAIKTFGIELDKTEGVTYYSNDNVMDVSELLIIKLKDKSDGEAFRDKIEKHIEEQKKLYKSYAPKQYALLDNSIVEASANTVFYCAAENAAALNEAFKKAL